MQLSPQQFEERQKAGRLDLSLIGMSNIGKTLWATILSGSNFEHVNCDDLIERKLAPQLKALGFSGIADVARWMGQPHEAQFRSHEKKYLDLEKETMEEIMNATERNRIRNRVIDTTGSVIHTGEAICEKLQKNSLVIYLEADEAMVEAMHERYIHEPKPVIFGAAYHPEAHEDQQEALKRCYRELLQVRKALYRRYADIIIPRRAIPENPTPDQCLQLIRGAL